MKLAIILIFTIIVTGLASLLPIGYAPDALHIFFSRYGIVLRYLMFVILLSHCTFFWTQKEKKNKKIIWSTALIIYGVLIAFVPMWEELGNALVMKMNEDRAIGAFRNPILGMEMRIDEAKGEVRYRFNDFINYEELVYGKNHGLSEISYEVKQEASFKKIYDENWWWYIDIN